MRRTGFTLLEATVALALVGVVAIGALEAFAAESRAAFRSRQLAPAVALASERLARLELLDAARLRALPESLRTGSVRDGVQEYAWRADVAPVPNEPDLYALTVDVRWAAGAYRVGARVFRAASVGGQ